MSNNAQIKARIKVLESHFPGKSGNQLGLDAGLGNATADGWTDNLIGKPSLAVEKFLTHYNIRKEWWKTGQGEVFIKKPTSVKNGAAVKENTLGEAKQMMEALFEMERISDYRFVPKTVLDGEYRIMPKSELEQRTKELEQKAKEYEDLRLARLDTINALNKVIAVYEGEIADLRAKLATPQKTK